MMGLFNLINKNLFWVGLITFCCGVYFGGVGAWGVQNIRLRAVKTQYDDLVYKFKEEAEEAKRFSQKIADANKYRQEMADQNYAKSMDNLRTDIKRLQDARASSRFLPATSTTSTSAKGTCFSGPELERTLRQFDRGIQELITEGDQAIVGLNSAKAWALNN